MTHCPISQKPCPYNCQERCSQDHVSFKGEIHEFRETPKGWQKPVQLLLCKRQLTEDEIIMATNAYNEKWKGDGAQYFEGYCDALQTIASPAELQQQAELVKQMRVLLMFVEEDGTVINGFRTKEIIQRIKELTK